MKKLAVSSEKPCREYEKTENIILPLNKIAKPEKYKRAQGKKSPERYRIKTTFYMNY